MRRALSTNITTIDDRCEQEKGARIDGVHDERAERARCEQHPAPHRVSQQPPESVSNDRDDDRFDSVEDAARRDGRTPVHVRHREAEHDRHRRENEAGAAEHEAEPAGTTPTEHHRKLCGRRTGRRVTAPSRSRNSCSETQFRETTASSREGNVRGRATEPDEAELPHHADDFAKQRRAGAAPRRARRLDVARAATRRRERAGSDLEPSEPTSSESSRITPRSCASASSPALRRAVAPNHATGDDLVAPGDETGVGHAMEEGVQRAGRDAVAVARELFAQPRAMHRVLAGVMQHV